MAFNTHPAWHGIGTNIGPDCRDAETAMQAAGLNWEVEKHPLVATVANASGHPQPIEAHGSFAIIRSAPLRVLSVVGSHYTPLQNRDAFKFFEPVLNELGGVFETAGSLYGGRRIWALVKLGGDITVARNDKLHKYVILSNAHDGQSRVRYGFTCIRVCCTNTLRLALADYESFGIRHRRNVAVNVSEAGRVIGQAVDAFNTAAEIFNRMALHRFSDSAAKAYFRKVYKRPAAVAWRAEDRLMGLFHGGRGNDAAGVRGTLWAAYNAVTEFEDYKPYYAEDATSRRLEQVWWGIGAGVKFNALSVARRVARGYLELAA